MSPTHTGAMNTSSSLQIPDPSVHPSSRQYNASRTVSVTVGPTPTSSQPPGRKRASHTVQSSQQPNEDQHVYHDVHSHPAAVAYAAAHPRRTIPKFGPYLLLQTLGEGEFGKVKLGLHGQWGEEVAVKLIRRGNIDSSVRMSKVEREIEVLRTLKHPNIVRLYDVIETDKYIGIILEYASGGELFDHILAHRYLRERDAAKLFSQLISGVWYIHQKKIVHRDLKLENLLLDRHRNVIITDFGFANRFEHRADDLMQTSCGSPCYAAPELVISEGLYVGSAVDIWSCGVILYAMLAGYLPFDDDPANPDGDNINLLYKYIVNTPLSFPDYISVEARDLLSLMLVPEPARRADLPTVMAHPWLAAYASTFQRSVDELERAAMEQHQMKRLAYQRQMKQAAAAAEFSKVSRSQSARMDPYGAGAPTSSQRSRSYKEAPSQPEYLYETSVDQSAYASPVRSSSTHRKNIDVSANFPQSPIDDDPFAPSSRDILAAREPSPMMVDTAPDGDARGGGSSNRQRGRDENGQATNNKSQLTSPASDGPQPKGGFRHTIQVEYDEPETPEQRRAARHPSQKGGAAQSRRDAEEMPRKRTEEYQRGRTTSHNQSSATERSRKGSQGSVKPLPPAPMATSPTSSRPKPGRSTPTMVSPTISRSPQPDTAIAQVNAASVVAAPGGPAAEKSLQNVQSETGSTGSHSSKQSQHRKGLSLDKLGLGKIFNPTQSGDQNGSSSRVPSEASVVTDGSKSSPKQKQDPSQTAVTGSKSSLLSPGENGRKSRRNTLTVMVEPIARSLKSRTKGKSTVRGEKSGENVPPHSAVPITTPQSAEETPPVPFGSVSRTDIGVGLGMPASTSKARKVMQWFRSKSKSREPFDVQDVTILGDQAEKREQTPTQNDFEPIGSPVPLTPSPVQVVVTTPTAVEHPSIRAPGYPQRSVSSATESSFSPPSLAARIRNSVGVVVPTPAKGMLRIHHGAVDQTTITTRAPPEVMKHVRAVLEGMGMEISVEGEYKYRCVRLKKKKSVGLGLRDGAGNGGSLAAITMAGSAASNGVDKRGLPIPPSFHTTGGMLRGLLMRRQSSQVSNSGLGSQSSANFDDDTISPGTSPLVTEPPTMFDPIYGDSSQDAGDEVRFSVELTRLDRLKDTFSLDIRRLKGNLRSYKFLYDTLRERADLQR